MRVNLGHCREPRPVLGSAVVSRETPVARWRAAKLAAVAADLSRLGHDLRGILAPALLAAERAQVSPDANASRAAEVMVRAVDRATEALNATLAMLRDGLPATDRRRLGIRAIIETVPASGLSVRNTVPADAFALADPAQLVEALSCLFAHARTQGAATATVALLPQEHMAALRISHDGGPAADTGDPFAFPSEPEYALDLPIACELARAMRGTLVRADGTAFDLSLPTADFGS